MLARRLTIVAFAGSIALTQPLPVLAGGADGIVGGIVGGIIGGAIVNSANNHKKQTTTVYRKPSSGISSATRAQNQQVQSALNYFGFPVGTADGVLGARSRASISEYQMYIGYAPTGYLTDFEQNFLTQSYMRAQAGGFSTQQTMASLPDGPRGLIRMYRDQQLQASSMAPMGAMPPPQMAVAPQYQQPSYQPAPTMAAQAAPLPPQIAAPVAVPEPVAAAPVAPPVPPAPEVAAALAVPNFMADEAVSSVTSYCNMVSLRTSNDGGFVTEASMTDPRIALDEQFCLARTYAIANGDALIQKVKGVTPAQIEAQCAQFGPLLKDDVAALSFKSPGEVMKDVGDFVLASGISPNQLKGTAEICLAVGYRTDNLDVTLGSALLLTVLGERPYAELMGHHLVNGFGASQRNDLALAWYAVGIDALDTGASPVFAASLPQRTQLLRASVTSLGSGNGAGGAGQVTQASGAPAVPSFAISQ